MLSIIWKVIDTFRSDCRRRSKEQRVQSWKTVYIVSINRSVTSNNNFSTGISSSKRKTRNFRHWICNKYKRWNLAFVCTDAALWLHLLQKSSYLNGRKDDVMTKMNVIEFIVWFWNELWIFVHQAISSRIPRTNLFLYVGTTKLSLYTEMIWATRKFIGHCH